MDVRAILQWRWIAGPAAIVKTFLRARCSMHAAGLTYFSILSIVPLLCVLLVGARMMRAERHLKTFVNERMEEWIGEIESGPEKQLAPGAEVDPELQAERRAAADEIVRQARDMRDAIFERIEGFGVGTLGWAGFAMLVWTVVGSIGMIEDAFNYIFGVTRNRVLWKRFLLYIAVLVLLPPLVALAASMPLLKVAKDLLVSLQGYAPVAKWMSSGLIAVLDSGAFRLVVSGAFSTLAFALIFKMLPNCRVQMRPALCAGVITAVLFGGWLKLCAVAQVGIARSSALYGSFALFPIVCAWFYVSWQIVLLGCCVAHHLQTARSRREDILPSVTIG